jgi:hypothetical protein
MNIPIKLLDVVALTEDMPHEGYIVGRWEQL